MSLRIRFAHNTILCLRLQLISVCFRVIFSDCCCELLALVRPCLSVDPGLTVAFPKFDRACAREIEGGLSTAFLLPHATPHVSCDKDFMMLRLHVFFWWTCPARQEGKGR